MQNYLQKITKVIPVLLLITFSMIGLSGCDLTRNYLKADRDANAEIQDFRDTLASRVQDDNEEKNKRRASSSSIPSMQSYIAQSTHNKKSMPLVSVSVNQGVPVRDVLFELARQADYDLELDPSITGAIIFSARERPLDEVVDRISKMAGLRYNFKDNVLRVEVDRPYNQTYKVDYLSFVRKNQGSIRNNVAVVSGDGADTGSSFESTSESEVDFWSELSANLEQILNIGASNLATLEDPVIASEDSSGDFEEDSSGDFEDDGTLNIESLPVDGSNGSSGGIANAQSTFSVNKQAGLISVYAPELIQQQISAYLDLVRKSVTAQVLIEAKILEVRLTDEFSTGIDWEVVGNNVINEGLLGFGTSVGSISAATNTRAALSGVDASSEFRLGYFGDDVNAIVEAISRFGTTRALASPRLTVLNNQSAVLNVADNRVFFELDIDVTTDDGTTETEIDSEIRNVPEGVLVNVQPSINLDTGRISMAVRPTITRVVDEINDPAVQFVTAQNNIQGVQSLIPELNVQEIDSVIQMRSGQPIVMGGLLQDSMTSQQEALPVLGEVPVFGALFRNQLDSMQKTELVILLKATILESESDSFHSADRDIYKKFSNDRRPFRF